MYNLTNTDLNTGIRYSTIYANHINPESLDDTIQESEDLSYYDELAAFREDLQASITHAIRSNTSTILNPDTEPVSTAITDLIATLEEQFNDQYEPYEPVYLYDHDGYLIEYHSSDNSLLIIKSPYYTFSHLASPCFPNGCYLPDYDPTHGQKCYCLDDTFFDEYNPSPYPFIYNVTTNERVSCTSPFQTPL
jgi:hypothetical protein